MSSLFDLDAAPPSREPLEEGAVLLRGFVAVEAARLIEDAERVAKAAPFRQMVTPGGYTMSVAMTNCGRVGWVSERSGYRYDPIDPTTGAHWPALPAAFLDLAVRAAAERMASARCNPASDLAISPYCVDTVGKLNSRSMRPSRGSPGIGLGVPDGSATNVPRPTSPTISPRRNSSA